MGSRKKAEVIQIETGNRWQNFFAKRWYLLFILPIVAFIVSFPMGKYPISIPDMFHTIWYHIFDPSKIMDVNLETTIFNIRLPRIFAALLIGGGLSVSGASYQGMFKNPMVSPDILGATSGAAFCACVSMLLGAPLWVTQVVSFLGGIAAVAVATGATKRLSRSPILGLVLGGIMVGTLCEAGTSAVKLLADADDKLPQITFWLMGGLNKLNLMRLVSLLIPMFLGFFILMRMRWQLNVLSFGEDEARSLGIKTTNTRRLIILASTLITASTVSVCGMVGWVGLIIPHVARAVVGANFRKLIPASALIGAAFLVLVDDVARCAFSIELPIGILTSFLGVPFFFFIFSRRAKGGDDIA